MIIVDMQKAYYRGEAANSMAEASEYINEVLSYYRAAGEPVVWIQDQDDEDGVVPGTEGFDLIDELEPAAGEPVIIKKYGNSFNKTELAETLGAAGVDTVVICGYCAEYCVTSTYRGALDYDFTPFLLKNGIAGGNRDRLEAVEKISDMIPFKFLRQLYRKTVIED